MVTLRSQKGAHLNTKKEEEIVSSNKSKNQKRLSTLSTCKRERRSKVKTTTNSVSKNMGLLPCVVLWS